MKDLEALMRHIATTWVCDENRYPELRGKDAEARRNFLAKHSTAHLLKTMGKIASVTEHFDHEGSFAPGQEEALKELALKLVVNSLKFAEDAAGLSADDILKRAPAFIV
jgi:hypothetical protein